MGYGIIHKGKQTPITPFYRSWACQETQRKRQCHSCIHGKDFHCQQRWPLTNKRKSL